jgi:hypothetical protein
MLSFHARSEYFFLVHMQSPSKSNQQLVRASWSKRAGVANTQAISALPLSKEIPFQPDNASLWVVCLVPPRGGKTIASGLNTDLLQNCTWRE